VVQQHRLLHRRRLLACGAGAQQLLRRLWARQPGRLQLQQHRFPGPDVLAALQLPGSRGQRGCKAAAGAAQALARHPGVIAVPAAVRLLLHIIISCRLLLSSSRLLLLGLREGAAGRGRLARLARWLCRQHGGLLSPGGLGRRLVRHAAAAGQLLQPLQQHAAGQDLVGGHLLLWVV
jgi:hypothetical protein